MNSVTIDWLAMAIAVVASMVIGAAWYAPPLFGRSWMGHVGKTEQELREGGKLGYLVAVLTAVLTALILTYVLQWSDADTLVEGLLAGVVMWLGFTVTPLLLTGVFEQRPWGLIMINAGHHLTVLAVMGAILGAMAGS